MQFIFYPLFLSVSEHNRTVYEVRDKSVYILSLKTGLNDN